MAGEKVTSNSGRPTAANANAGHNGGAGAAATITLAASTVGLSWNVGQVAWSYSDDPAAGSSITLTDGTTGFTCYVTSAGPGFIIFNPPRRYPPNAAVTFTVSAPGGSILASANVDAWKE